MTYTTVGHSATETLMTPGLKVFTTRITVHAGDVLGLRAGAEAMSCYGNGQTGDTAENSADNDPDPAVGSPFNSATTNNQTTLNIAATVEPDQDGDGFGDESQDNCPRPSRTRTKPMPTVTGSAMYATTPTRRRR